MSLNATMESCRSANHQKQSYTGAPDFPFA